MKKYTSLAFAALLGLAMASPLPLHAAASATSSPAASVSKASTYPFHGKVTAVDVKKNTFTLEGKTPRVFVVSSSTKIKKNGKAATLKDAVVGDDCGGMVTKAVDGKLNATSVRFGPKPESKAAKKTAAAAATSPAASPSPAPAKP